VNPSAVHLGHSCQALYEGTLEPLYSSCWGVLKEQNMSDKEQGKSRPLVKQAKLVRYQ